MVIHKILPFGAIVTGLALVFSTSGYTSAPKANLSYFYQFNGNASDVSQLTNAAYYNRVTPSCDNEFGDLCGINLPSDSQQPNGNPDQAELSQYASDLQLSVTQSQSTVPGIIEMRQ